jgi:hypothetical protein
MMEVTGQVLEAIYLMIHVKQSLGMGLYLLQVEAMAILLPTVMMEVTGQLLETVYLPRHAMELRGMVKCG